MATAAVTFKNVSVSYRGEVVLEDITLEIAAGSYVGILGPNGAGKSTLLKVILGLIQPDVGEVLVFGQKPRNLRGRGEIIGYLPQRPLANPNFPVSVLDVVLMGRYGLLGIGRRPSRQDREIALGFLAQVGMAGHAHSIIGSLSGGEQQRVFIARALSVEPRLLIMDEPTISLDACAQDELYELIHQLQEQMDLTVIMVSHDIGAISENVGDVICLNRRVYVHQPPPIGRLGLEKTFGCSVEYLFHGEIPHRVVRIHDD
ncbi:MAG: metal ABC transporter ATP-binding protein [Desulfobacca sp.]|uniref:metal ABC transporter ATP-binding protein n=1 Tax=Desulfobacca sp. TaxID=2067990 RepID=UPI00404952F2